MMHRPTPLSLRFALLLSLGGLSGLAIGCEQRAADHLSSESGAAAAPLVVPPFEVSGDAEGLLLVYFDAEGVHTAARRSEIPEENRMHVRVDDLSRSPDERASLEGLYVADLSATAEDGAYAVRLMSREDYDSLVDAARPAPAIEEPSVEGATHADVIVYGASWCSACRATKNFLRQRNVPFVERDIEREPGAREAMMSAAQAAGVSTTGIPVIDFRGRVIAGFNQPALEAAIRETGQAANPTTL